MAKLNKVFVKDVKVIDDAIAALKGESYTDEKRNRLVLLGSLYHARARWDARFSIGGLALTPEEYELVKDVPGISVAGS
jgi:hypothetical protein